MEKGASGRSTCEYLAGLDWTEHWKRTSCCKASVTMQCHRNGLGTLQCSCRSWRCACLCHVPILADGQFWFLFSSQGTWASTTFKPFNLTNAKGTVSEGGHLHPLNKAHVGASQGNERVGIGSSFCFHVLGTLSITLGAISKMSCLLAG